MVLMTKRVCPLALPQMLYTEFITYIQQNHRPPTIVVVCCSSEVFLNDLQRCILHPNLRNEFSDQNDDTQSSLHHLLIPTMLLIANSRTIRLAFVPTLPHLRAFLSIYKPATEMTSFHSPDVRSGPKIPIFAVWGMVNLHRSTAEHSAQGLSRTLAMAVEAASLAGQRLILVESRKRRQDDSVDTGGTLFEALDDPWKEQVSLLSGILGFVGENRASTGQTVEVGKVVGKWCNFTRLIDVSNNLRDSGII